MDAIKLRYGWEFNDILSVCVCGDLFDADHALICMCGGYILKKIVIIIIIIIII